MTLFDVFLLDGLVRYKLIVFADCFRGQRSPWRFSYKAMFAAWRNLKIKTTTEAVATRFNIVVRHV